MRVFVCMCVCVCVRVHDVTLKQSCAIVSPSTNRRCCSFEFSKVSSLLSVLYKTTMELTFEDFSSAKMEILKSQLTTQSAI